MLNPPKKDKKTPSQTKKRAASSPPRAKKEPAAAAPRSEPAAEAPFGVPTHAEIAERAYQIYVSRGSRNGHAREDWLEAERDLRSAQVRQRDSMKGNA